MKVEDIESVDEYYKLSFDQIRIIATLKLPIKLSWLSSLDSMTVFRIKDEFFIAYNYEIKSLVKETKDLYEYYVKLFNLVELWRDENSIFKITGLKIKNWENLNTDRLNKSFSVVFRVINTTNILGEVCKNHLNLLKKIHFQILENFSSVNSNKTLRTLFEFPENIKIPCKQYLEYFVQFLNDLGVNVTSGLKEEAGKVLFSVTPTDDVEALDKIREALAVYLNLPSSSISDIEYSENFALMRLQQQVRNLQHSQQMAKTEILSAQYALNLAQQNIENQDRIIVRQNSVIENLSGVLEKITSNSIMIDSIEKQEQKEEFVEIYEGLRAGESKWLRELTGLGLNLPKFINAAVKNTFAKDDEKKSVLGLDEETENN